MAKPPQNPPLNGRPQHLIEAAGAASIKCFFSAPLTTRAPPTTVQPDVRPGVQQDVRLDIWPNVRPNARPNARPDADEVKYL